ncbi:MAG: hypothetical protein CVU39_09925 [Chloroflexi bacterium HGW-Chloroflexi-10]|nr:MAG: hypothetical protein CVU39_09925 [Chloroflexi bacterium HGW-Chloroflexi-10]
MPKKTAIFSASTILLFCILACNLQANVPTPTPTTQEATQGNTETVAQIPTETALPPTPTNTDIPTSTSAPTEAPTAVPSPTVTNTPVPCNLAQFVADVTVSDNETFTTGSAFTKTWRLKNIGSCSWTSGYQIIYVSGDGMSGPQSAAFTNGAVDPGATVDISINLTAPASPGTYKGLYKLRAPDGTTFGIGGQGSDSFWVQIVAEAEEVQIPTLSRNLSLTTPRMLGEDVMTLQKRLLELGYSELGKADGIFGPKTDQVVRDFQEDQGLTVDGVVGKKTWERLWR